MIRLQYRLLGEVQVYKSFEQGIIVQNQFSCQNSAKQSPESFLSHVQSCQWCCFYLVSNFCMEITQNVKGQKSAFFFLHLLQSFVFQCWHRNHLFQTLPQPSPSIQGWVWVTIVGIKIYINDLHFKVLKQGMLFTMKVH